MCTRAKYRTVKGYVYLFGTVIKIKLFTKPFIEPKKCNKETCWYFFCQTDHIIIMIIPPMKDDYIKSVKIWL